MSDGSGGITRAVKDELSETFKEVKQQVISPSGNQQNSINHKSDPRLAQLAQQDKIQSAQKEASIKQELARMTMKNHVEASNLGITRESPRPALEEVRPQKSVLSPAVLPGSKNNFGTPLDTKLAVTKRESRDSKAVG